MKNEFIPTILCLITKAHQCNELLFLELFKARPRVELLVERPPLVREALVIQGTPPPWFVMLQQVVILSQASLPTCLYSLCSMPNKAVVQKKRKPVAIFFLATPMTMPVGPKAAME